MRLVLTGFSDFTSGTTTGGTLLPNTSRLLLEMVEDDKQSFIRETGVEDLDLVIFDCRLEFFRKIDELMRGCSDHDLVLSFGQNGPNLDRDDKKRVVLTNDRAGFQVESRFTNVFNPGDRRFLTIGSHPELVNSFASEIVERSENPLIYVNDQASGAGTYYCNATGYKITATLPNNSTFTHIPMFFDENSRECFWSTNIGPQTRSDLASQGHQDASCIAIMDPAQAYQLLKEMTRSSVQLLCAA